MNFPKVSLITPTYNRQEYLKMGVVDFMLFDYPVNKLEWIIIDDTPSQSIMENILPEDERIKYYYFSPEQTKEVYKQYRNKLLNTNKKTNQLNKNVHFKLNHFVDNKLPIGLKYNLAINYASGDVIIHMSDDCHYPPNSIQTRIKYFNEHPMVQCIGCSTIDQFHTIKMISIKNKAHNKMRASSRIYNNTLAYYRNFWEKQHFDNSATEYEIIGFLKHRSELCEEISAEEIVVSLIHPLNYKEYKSTFDTMQPNGWHFDKLTDEHFLLITSLGEKQIS